MVYDRFDCKHLSYSTPPFGLNVEASWEVSHVTIIFPHARGWRNEDPEPRVGGEGGLAEKKIVTSPILMAEVVVDVPKGTSDGSPGV